MKLKRHYTHGERVVHTSDVEITNEHRKAHTHLVGASGTSKSKYLEHLIREDILVARRFCSLDPHKKEIHNDT